MAANGDPGEDDLSRTARGMRAAEPYFAAVWKLVGGAAFGVLAGYFLDKRFHTTPWILVGLSSLGIVVGFYGFIHDMLKLGKKR